MIQREMPLRLRKAIIQPEDASRSIRCFCTRQRDQRFIANFRVLCQAGDPLEQICFLAIDLAQSPQGLTGGWRATCLPKSNALREPIED